jgi:glyoxylase-like metal-dependent hydrolase (beta-lactamase superfamily II)
VLYKVPVEIVTMRFRKPGPSENTVQDLAHFVSLRSIVFEDSPPFTIRPFLFTCQSFGATPQITYRDRLPIHLGGKEILVLYLGRGHTRSDSIIFVPQDRIAYVSELYFSDQFLYINDGME